MTLETENKSGSERRDFAREEKKEIKEGREDAELKAAAALERADFLVREVKTTKNQMQNLLMHIQAVIKAIRELREAMELPPDHGNHSSVEQDKKRLDDLRKKIAEYRNELMKMKDELLQEQMAILRKKNPRMAEADLLKEANAFIDSLVGSAGEE